jgi:hypothetical protein
MKCLMFEEGPKVATWILLCCGLIFSACSEKRDNGNASTCESYCQRQIECLPTEERREAKDSAVENCTVDCVHEMSSLKPSCGDARIAFLDCASELACSEFLDAMPCIDKIEEESKACQE